MKEIEFELPNGLEIDGKVYKRGKVRGLTMGDEIEIAGDPRVKNNPAYQLPISLVRAITQFEDLPIPVATEKIMQLGRRDYLYLANRVAEATDEGIDLTVQCPHCQKAHKVSLDSLLEAGGPLF